MMTNGSGGRTESHKNWTPEELHGAVHKDVQCPAKKGPRRSVLWGVCFGVVKCATEKVVKVMDQLLKLKMGIDFLKFNL